MCLNPTSPDAAACLQSRFSYSSTEDGEDIQPRFPSNGGDVVSNPAMSGPAEGNPMPTNETNQLLRQLLQKIEEIIHPDVDTSARIRMLETSSQLPGRRADATTTPTTTPPIAEVGDPPIHTNSKPHLSLPYPPTSSGSKSQWRGWKLKLEVKIEEDALAIGILKAQISVKTAKSTAVTIYEVRTSRLPRGLSWCSYLTSMSTFYRYQH
jgi:hypothetical protein